MGLLLKDPLHDQFACWALGYAPYGGADPGEVVAIIRAVGNGDGDDSAFYDAWTATADRLVEQGEACLSKDQRHSAREFYLHAASFYSFSYRPLFGEPVDPRLLATFRKQMAVFDKAMALSEPPVERLQIPFEGTSLPGYLMRAVGHEGERRPLLIATNGYDASVTDMFFATGMAAVQRGYHCLLFDGPGQGAVLIEQGIPLRPDWENVVRPVVDFVLTLPNIDAGRIALTGWSLGGHLAPRAASGEHRLAACIADPGNWGIGPGLRQLALEFGLPQAQADAIPNLDEATLQRMSDAISADRRLRWSVIQRGYWVNGVSTLGDYLRSGAQFTLAGRVEKIRCPTLITSADRDPLARGAQSLYDALMCPKAILHFTAAEGAGDHVETMNRSLLNRRVFDWLDGIFTV
jgi:alpha-beta hydrolase superfamily lysophospholipase